MTHSTTEPHAKAPTATVWAFVFLARTRFLSPIFLTNTAKWCVLPVLSGGCTVQPQFRYRAEEQVLHPAVTLLPFPLTRVHRAA